MKHQIISAEKWWIPKLYNSSISTTFILVIFSSGKVIVNIVHKSTCLWYSLWNYEWYVNLWIIFTNTLSNEEVAKIRVVDSDEFNNFYVHDFCSWNHLRFQNHVWSCRLLKFKIWTIQILSNEKMTKIKVVDSDVFNNFYIHHLYSWNHLVDENQVWSCHFLKFKIWIIQN